MKPNQLNFITNNSGLFMMTIYVPSGSIYENIGSFKDKKVSGISHFIEHLLFKHTEKYTGKEVLQNFTKLGGFYNASTDKDQTMFYVKTLVENYNMAIDLLYEVVMRPRFKRYEVGTERKIVLEELGQTKDDYDDILYKGSNESIFDKDNIYLPPVIGNKSHLTHTKFNTLWEYYCKRFKNCLVLVNCDHSYRQKVNDYIVAKMFNGKKELKQFDFYEPELEKLSLKTIRKVIVDVQDTVQYNSCLTFLSYPFKDFKNNIILDFVKFCLTDAGLYSVLSYAIREKRGLVYSIKATNEKMRYIGLFKIYFGTSNKNLVSILQVIVDLLSDIKKDGLKKDVLLFYKTSYLNHVKYRFTNEEYRATWHGDNIFYGIQLTEKEYIAYIEKITNEDIKKIFDHVFKFPSMSIYTFGKYKDTKALQKEISNIYSTQSNSQH
jgi:predicted Zn-dependent peptidase